MVFITKTAHTRTKMNKSERLWTQRTVFYFVHGAQWMFSGWSALFISHEPLSAEILEIISNLRLFIKMVLCTSKTVDGILTQFPSESCWFYEWSAKSSTIKNIASYVQHRTLILCKNCMLKTSLVFLYSAFSDKFARHCDQDIRFSKEQIHLT